MKKIKFIIPTVILAFGCFMVMTSCEKKEAYEGDDYNHITDINDIPLNDDEKLNLYEDLIHYIPEGLFFGSGIDLSDYTSKTDYREMVNRNFNSITVGYDMKHGAMVGGSGALNFVRVDNFITGFLPETMELYGHTLAWHQNQNATYLKGLIAPTPIPDPLGTNLFDLSVLNDGTFVGWTKQNNAAGITIVDGKGLQATDKAIQFVNTSTSANYWDTQLVSPAITVDPAGTYVLSFYIKGNAAGQLRISFDGLSNNYPWLNWLGTGSAEYFTTDGTWQHVQVTLPDPTAATFKVQFDMGKTPDVTYWIDVNTLELVNLNSGTPPPSYTNLIAVGTFDSYAAGADPYPDWNAWGGTGSPVREISADGEGYGGVGKSLIIHSQGTSVDYQVQAVTNFTSPLIEGNDYHAEAWIRSSVVGSVQLSTQSTAQYSGAKTVETAWTKITWDFTADAPGPYTTLVFNLGAVSADYYIDSVLVYDRTGTVTPSYTNLISNPDFERDDLPGNNYYELGDWNAYGDNGPTRARVSTEAHGGDYSMKLTNPVSGSLYQSQAIIPVDFIDGNEYYCEAWVKVSVANSKIQMFLQNAAYSSQYGSTETISGTTEWVKITWDIVSSGSNVRFGFQFGETVADYYIDDVLVYDKNARRSFVFKSKARTAPTTKKTTVRAGVIEKTPEEKAQITSDALEDWITKMVTHYKGRVRTWDALNEPVAENGQPRNASNTDATASDVFVWQEYIGKAFGVKAFQYAQLAGNPDDILFINDYNLEYSSSKLQGFLDYAQYIDDSLATLGLRPIDGLGTQLHVSITSNKQRIDEMFIAMAATGKLIKVTELDVKVGTTTPSPTQLEEQKEMYWYIINSYMQNVPEAQRYGITVWGVNDGNANWLSDDAPCLWNKNLIRKPAYKGAADGLAGRDVGEDFTYDDLKNAGE
ncbi:MAG: endo-1,4-beta-xylanase [Bacteroidales bacterium]|nr:endo-1,4-beta-xylanase [Bacteroidales bacterium]MCL2132971.1 endo-1,4-beta-xylanase [Bacteroidales bacterium]